MSQHKNGAYSVHRSAGRAAEPSVAAREALTRYLSNIFPNEPATRLLFVADHQIEWLKREGFRIVPVVTTDV
jgi:hypothetical protein